MTLYAFVLIVSVVERLASKPEVDPPPPLELIVQLSTFPEHVPLVVMFVPAVMVWVESVVWMVLVEPLTPTFIVLAVLS
jgi:hypothetical protein